MAIELVIVIGAIIGTFLGFLPLLRKFLKGSLDPKTGRALRVGYALDAVAAIIATYLIVGWLTLTDDLAILIIAIICGFGGKALFDELLKIARDAGLIK